MKLFSFRIIILLVLIPLGLVGQDFWTPVSESDRMAIDFPERDMPVMESGVFLLEFDQIRDYLASAPLHFTNNKGISLDIPFVDGSVKNFKVFESPVLAEALALKYPGLKSFTGKSSDGSRIHLGFGPQGFHAMISDNGEVVLIDNYNFSDTRYYVVYKMIDYPTNFWTTFKCGNEDHLHDDINHHLFQLGMDNEVNRNGDPVSLRTYRLAMATTKEYSSEFGSTKASVMEELNKLVTRVNMVLYNDIAARLELIPETEDLIQITGNSYDNGQPDIMIDQNPIVFQANGVTPDLYDIGHVLGTNGGGLAQLESLCSEGSNKARGVSTWSTVQGDPFHIQVVAHEFGHQFGSRHTFNNCDYGGNENEGTGYEPGSGHTIMSYFGLCGPDNVAGNQLDNYHWYSLGIMYNHISETHPNCGTILEGVNTRPTSIIEREGGFHIPIGTPFSLTGRGEDNESDSSELTYSWEQADIGPKSRLGQPEGTAPLFRVYAPTSNPTRYFPNLPHVLSGTNTKEEVLPQITRPLTFRLVVRDNDPNGGAFGQSEIGFFSNANAGPFEVVTSTAGKTYEVGDYIEIEWDVAGTNLAPINCEKVNIIFARSNGQERFVIAENVENNGSVEIEIPDLVANGFRIFIEAADNIFYNVSDGNFSIVEPSEPTLSVVPREYFNEICAPETATLTLDINPIDGFSGTAEVSYVGGLPDDAVVNFNKDIVDAEDVLVVTIDFIGAAPVGLVEMELNFLTSNGINLMRRIQFEVLSLNPIGINAVAPVDGAEGIAGNAVLRWTSVDHADEYTVRIRSVDWSVNYTTTTVDTFFSLPNLLPAGSTFYWSVAVVNRCGDGAGVDENTYSFATVNSSCETFDSGVSSANPFILPSNNPTTRELIVNVPSGGSISDVNIPVFNGTTAQISALTVDLISPEGTQVTLLRNTCGTSANWNVPFDDEAISNFGCPITDGETKKSQFGNLKNFVGEDSAGDWIFRFNNNSFNNVQVRGLSLEICGATIVNPPALLANELLEVPTLGYQVITQDLLRAEEASSSNDEIIYTIIEAPKKGHLKRYGLQLYLGETFTQSAINDFGMEYHHTGSADDEFDNFVFIITTTAGGYLGTFQFNIAIDEAFMTSINEFTSEFDILVYPNPTKGSLNIEIPVSYENLDLDLLGMDGRVISNYTIIGVKGGDKRELNLNGLSSGTYILRYKSNSKIGFKKIIVI